MEALSFPLLVVHLSRLRRVTLSHLRGAVQWVRCGEGGTCVPEYPNTKQKAIYGATRRISAIRFIFFFSGELSRFFVRGKKRARDFKEGPLQSLFFLSKRSLLKQRAFLLQLEGEGGAGTGPARACTERGDMHWTEAAWWLELVFLKANEFLANPCTSASVVLRITTVGCPSS